MTSAPRAPQCQGGGCWGGAVLSPLCPAQRATALFQMLLWQDMQTPKHLGLRVQGAPFLLPGQLLVTCEVSSEHMVTGQISEFIGIMSSAMVFAPF